MSGRNLKDGGKVEEPLSKMLAKLRIEEARSYGGRGAKFQYIDFMGAAYGAYFIWDGWRKKQLLNVFIGSTMVYIHTIRFAYAPQGGDEGGKA